MSRERALKAWETRRANLAKAQKALKAKTKASSKTVVVSDRSEAMRRAWVTRRERAEARAAMLSARAHKAWQTRRANQQAAEAR
jgi:hypothetical protein